MRTESSECQNIEFTPEELQVIKQVQEIVNSSDRFEEEERPDVLEVVKHSRCMADQWKKEGGNPETPQKTNNLYYRLQVLLGDLQVDPGLLERYTSDLESIKDKWDAFVQANKNMIDELFELIHTEGRYNEALNEIALSILRSPSPEMFQEFSSISQARVFSGIYIAKQEAICLKLSEAMRQVGIDPEPFYR